MTKELTGWLAAWVAGMLADAVRRAPKQGGEEEKEGTTDDATTKGYNDDRGKDRRRGQHGGNGSSRVTPTPLSCAHRALSHTPNKISHSNDNGNNKHNNWDDP